MDPGEATRCNCELPWGIWVADLALKNQVVLMWEVPEAFPMSSQIGSHSTKVMMVDKDTR